LLAYETLGTNSGDANDEIGAFVSPVLAQKWTLQQIAATNAGKLVEVWSTRIDSSSVVPTSLDTVHTWL